MTDRPSIILDCDPGIDDAFAIFCALRHCDLRAITTVSGNVSIENTTRNALHLLELAGAPDVPVHRGAAAPLEVAPATASYVHGPSGLGADETPTPAATQDPLSAVDALSEHAAGGGLTIVATGPLTNIAQAVLADPSFADRVDRIWWMGGSTQAGNVTAHAEFNAWADPHAVDVVFRSGVPLTMFGLNLTHQVRMDATHAERLRAAATQTSSVAADFLAYYEANGLGDGNGQPMHDPCALLAVTHGALFSIAPSHIVVETADESTRGWTRVVNADETNAVMIDIAHTVDAPALIDVILDAATTPVVQ